MRSPTKKRIKKKDCVKILTQSFFYVQSPDFVIGSPAKP